MDISKIDTTNLNLKNGIKIGSDTANKQIIEFINVSCPYCKKWFFDSLEILQTAVTNGEIQRVIKLFDKEKASLQAGNVMHHYINQTDSQAALFTLEKLYTTQSQWKNLPLEEVSIFAEKELHLTKEPHHTQTATAIIAEAQQANIQFVPTLVLQQNIFDENITQAALLALIKK
ncbi:protein-disulfide isomerase [Enterococcus sp. PF1-24]|uniref:thioredoxin domain-containing protein n=1 Tax=unclassified Enterococcus TaxID=2608891 RepID=UPI0024750712|nr:MULTISPECIES: thioredoxin domain-containing protein [unclassified Enterococcus]MDH6363204.1 protein-disulfide isomerase [Enterococcus sp. PFB1-1]MDH6400298.1 protein-disulfide isomerase [Enterococcus sp. PF1-24]